MAVCVRICERAHVCAQHMSCRVRASLCPSSRFAAAAAPTTTSGTRKRQRTAGIFISVFNAHNAHACALANVLSTAHRRLTVSVFCAGRCRCWTLDMGLTAMRRTDDGRNGLWNAPQPPPPCVVRLTCAWDHCQFSNTGVATSAHISAWRTGRPNAVDMDIGVERPGQARVRERTHFGRHFL